MQKTGMLQSMELQTVGHNLVTKQQPILYELQFLLCLVRRIISNNNLLYRLNVETHSIHLQSRRHTIYGLYVGHFYYENMVDIL